MNRARVTFAALAVRDFRRQWIAATLASTAFMTTFVLVPIVAYQLTGSYAASGFAAMGNGCVLTGPARRSFVAEPDTGY